MKMASPNGTLSNMLPPRNSTPIMHTQSSFHEVIVLWSHQLSINFFQPIVLTITSQLYWPMKHRPIIGAMIHYEMTLVIFSWEHAGRTNCSAISLAVKLFWPAAPAFARISNTPNSIATFIAPGTVQWLVSSMAACLNSIELVDTGTFFVQVYCCPVSLCVTVTILLPCWERGDTVIRARSGRKSQKQNQTDLAGKKRQRNINN